MFVKVTQVRIPAMSTIGYGEGIGPDGGDVSFMGDHRAMRDLGEAMNQAMAQGDGPVMAGIESHQMLGGRYIEEVAS